jgi:hypothetical protein
MNSRIKPVRALFTALTLAACLSLIPACSSSAYKVLNLNEGIQGFSFEYPNGYNLIRLELRNDDSSKYTEVGLSKTYGSSYSELYVYLWYPEAGVSTATQLMDQLLSGAGGMADYLLVERLKKVVGDTLTEQTIFTADSAIESSNAVDTIPRPASYRVTTMMFGGVAVEIDQTCDRAVADISVDDYQHILDTFKILD